VNFIKKIELEKQQQPIINAIIKEGEKNRDVLEELKPKYSNLPSISPGLIGSKYLAKDERDTKNPFFRRVENQVYLRNTPIKFSGDNLVIGNRIIPMSENLYKLISRDEDIKYDELIDKEKEIYSDLAEKCDFFDGSRGSGGRNSNDYKIYKRIKEPIIEEYEGDGLISDSAYLSKRLKLFDK